MDIKVDLGKREKVVVTSSLRIIVTGLIAHHRWLGGVTWDYLNVLLGFVRLGHDVYYLEDSGQWPYTFEGSVGSDESWVAYDCTGHVKYLAEVMAQFGLEDRWAYRFPITPKWFGMSEAKRKAVFESADLLLDVSGTLEHPEHYRQVRRLVYMDTDPVFTQIALAQGQTERVDQYDIHFSVGECIGQTGPETGHDVAPDETPHCPVGMAVVCHATRCVDYDYELDELQAFNVSRSDLRTKRCGVHEISSVTESGKSRYARGGTPQIASHPLANRL